MTSISRIPLTASGSYLLRNNTFVSALGSRCGGKCMPCPLCRLASNKNFRFFTTCKQHYDFEQAWLDLCRGEEKASNAVKSYLRDYVEFALGSRPALHDQEGFESFRTITTVTAVMTHWRILVAHADNTLLRRKRREDPENLGLWTLRWDRGGPKHAPVTEISRVWRWCCLLQVVSELMDSSGLRRG